MARRCWNSTKRSPPKTGTGDGGRGSKFPLPAEQWHEVKPKGSARSKPGVETPGEGWRGGDSSCDKNFLNFMPLPGLKREKVGIQCYNLNQG